MIMAAFISASTKAAAYVPFSAEGHATLSPALFENFQRLIYAETGIWLGSSKTALLCGRLARRLRDLRISTLEEYFRFVTQPDRSQERMLMIDAITTNETHFFREPRHFEFLLQRLFPCWKEEAALGTRPKRIRIWSAGCSTGEEPYSLAMLLMSHFSPLLDWDVNVLATDISTDVLARAQAGVYSAERAQEIPAHLLHSFALQGVGEHEGQIKIKPEVQRLVTFTRSNLSQTPYQVDGPFDAIFCRNVLIYFDLESKSNVVRALTSHLAPSGLLFLGHAENLNGIPTGLKSVMPTVFGHQEDKLRLAALPVRAQ